jgi:hypothetical protein
MVKRNGTQKTDKNLMVILWCCIFITFLPLEPKMWRVVEGVSYLELAEKDNETIITYVDLPLESLHRADIDNSAEVSEEYTTIFWSVWTEWLSVYVYIGFGWTITHLIHFDHEIGGGMYLRNVGTTGHNHAAKRPKNEIIKSESPWKPKISELVITCR